MKEYQTPDMVKVDINPQEAFSSTYNCVLGETWTVEFGTNCHTDHFNWVDTSDYQCYFTPAV